MTRRKKVNKKHVHYLLHKREVFNRAVRMGFKADLQEAYLRDADLQEAYLRDANLQGADLREAYLRDADLQGANLQGADLRDADLQGANLQGANLQGADLRWADLRWANLYQANLIWANLRWVNIDFSVLFLGCKSFDFKDNGKIARQLAYHLCRIDCDDEEYKEMRNSIIDFANQFHRVDECGKLEVTND
jgi:hypothetical protein